MGVSKIITNATENYVKEKREHDLLKSKYNALKNENDVLSSKLKKFEDAQRNGYVSLVLAVDDNLILSGSIVQPHSHFTYIQDMDTINQPNYNRYPFTRLIDNKITIDNQLYIKYKTMGVIK